MGYVMSAPDILPNGHEGGDGFGAKKAHFVCICIEHDVGLLHGQLAQVLAGRRKLPM
jgi:hypothetical protein